jgi:hypothetical protein
MDTARMKGLTFYLEGNRIKVEALIEPNSETKALIDQLRDHRDELRSILLTPACWNCGATMTPTRDIYGNNVFACWSCAKSA